MIKFIDLGPKPTIWLRIKYWLYYKWQSKYRWWKIKQSIKNGTFWPKVTNSNTISIEDIVMANPMLGKEPKIKWVWIYKKRSK